MNFTIRSAESHDAKSCLRIFNSPDIHFFYGLPPFQTLRMWQQHIEHNEAAGRHILVADFSGYVAGCVTLQNNSTPLRQHVTTLGIAVESGYSGKGVGQALLTSAASYAFNWLRTIRLELEVFPDNHKAIALYERNGFRKEGSRQKAVFRDGQYCDLLMMSRLAP